MFKGLLKVFNFFIFIGIICAIFTGLYNAVGIIVPTIIVASGAVLFLGYRSYRRKMKLEYLRGKYKDEQIVQKIMSGFIWQGQTAAQLRDSLGAPTNIDTVVLKTKKKEVWKYQRRGNSRRYGLRVMLENYVVVGWDQKA